MFARLALPLFLRKLDIHDLLMHKMQSGLVQNLQSRKEHVGVRAFFRFVPSIRQSEDLFLDYQKRQFDRVRLGVFELALLIEKAWNSSLDSEEIDVSLNYHEAKRELEKKSRRSLA